MSAFPAAIRESPVHYPGSAISASGIVTANRRQQGDDEERGKGRGTRSL